MLLIDELISFKSLIILLLFFNALPFCEFNEITIIIIIATPINIYNAKSLQLLKISGFGLPQP